MCLGKSDKPSIIIIIIIVPGLNSKIGLVGCTQHAAGPPAPPAHNRQGAAASALGAGCSRLLPVGPSARHARLDDRRRLVAWPGL